MSKQSNWISAYEAIPLALKLPREITSFKLQQFGAGQAAANLGFIDAYASVSSGRAEGAQLGGGGVGLHGSAFLLNMGGVHSHELCADGIGWLAVFAHHKVANGSLAAIALSGHLCLRDPLRHERANDGSEFDRPVRAANVGAGRWVVTGCALVSPLANIGELQAGEPLVQVTGLSLSRAHFNQVSLSAPDISGASRDMVINKLDAHAPDTINVGCDAAYWVNRAPYLDVAVAEVADVEVFHGSSLGGGLLAIYSEPFGPQLPQLVNAQLGHVFTPLRDCRQRDVENFSQSGSAPSPINCGFCFHAATLARLRLERTKPYSLLKYSDGLIKL